MAAINLTARDVARFAALGEPAQIYDAKQTGLVLRVRGKNRATWSVIFRDTAGKRQRVTLRGDDALSLDAARAAARRILADAHEGKTFGSGQKRGPTMSELVERYYVVRKPRSAPHTRPMIAAHVLPALGSKRADSITRGEIALLLDRVAAGTADRKAAPASANRVYDDLKAIFSWGVERDFVSENPMLRLSRPADKRKRERVPTVPEMRSIIEKLPGAPFTESMRRIVTLLALTGCRAGEIAGLRKAECDKEAGLLRIDADRTKTKRGANIPLSPPALEILTAALDDVEHSSFVFPSPRDWNKPIESHAISTAVRRAQAYFGISHWTVHDFRRSIATNLSIEGVQPHIVEIILNHATDGVTRKHYNLATYVNEHRNALNLWADLIYNTL